MLATTDYVKKYGDKIANDASIDLQIVQEEMTEIEATVTTLTDSVDTLETNAIITDINKLDFIKRYLTNSSATISGSNLTPTVSSSKGTVAVENFVATITPASSGTVFTASNCYFTSLPFFYTWYESDSKTYSKLMSGEYKSLVLKIPVSVDNVKQIGVSFIIHIFDDGYNWSDSKAIQVVHAEIIDGVAYVLYPTELIKAVIDDNITDFKNFHVSLIVSPLLDYTASSTDDIVITFANIKYGFLTGNEDITEVDYDNLVNVPDIMEKTEIYAYIDNYVSDIYEFSAKDIVLNYTADDYSAGFYTDSTGAIVSREGNYGVSNFRITLSDYNLNSRTINITTNSGQFYINEYNDSGFIKQSYLAANTDFVLQDSTTYFTVDNTWVIDSLVETVKLDGKAKTPLMYKKSEIDDMLYTYESILTSQSLTRSNFTPGTSINDGGIQVSKSDTNYASLTNPISISALGLYNKTVSLSYSSGTVYIFEYESDGTFIRKDTVYSGNSVTLSDACDYIYFDWTWSNSSSTFSFKYNVKGSRVSRIEALEAKVAELTAQIAAL